MLLAFLFPPFGLPFLAPVALAPLLFGVWREPSARARFAMGWVAGMIQWGVTCSWIQATLAQYGGLNAPLSWLALALFAMAKGLHLGVFAALAGPLLGRWYAIPAIAALWAGLERTHSALGFTWLPLGNAGLEMGLPLRLAPWVGVYGLSFVFAMLAAAVVVVRRNRMELLWLAPLVLLALLPAIAVPAGPTEQAVALQPDIPGELEWTAEIREREVRRMSLRTLEAALALNERRPALLLWPEVPAPFYYYEDAVFRDHVTNLARLSKAGFLFGSVAHTGGREPLNSAVMLSPEGRLEGRYDKVHLVPFGEFVPPLFGWIEKVSSEAGSYAAGERAAVFGLGERTVGAFICYESAFPHFVRQFAAEGAEVLVNLSNDGYFGKSAARRQHLLLARMRAVENRRWLLRATNNGVTASIDPAGRVWDALPEFGVAAGRLRFGWVREKTAYTRFGDWFAWGCLAAGLLACGTGRALARS